MAGVALVGIGLLVVSFVRSGARPVSLDETARPTGSTQPEAVSTLRPEQGVYLYEGSGTDRLDTPPLSQAQGPQMPATVAHRADGCWTFKIDFSTNHWQSWIYCPTPDGGLIEEGGESYQRWELGAISFDSTSSFECTDAVVVSVDQRPGDVWEQSCSGTSTGVEGQATSAGPFTFVEEGDVEIGGTPVRALHYRRERTMTGAQRGTERSDVWMSAATGLPLRNTRTITATTSTLVGEVRYTEDGTFEATSSVPAR